MCSNVRSYSNPIYDVIDSINVSYSQPLMINIEPSCSHPSANANSIPLLLLANCLTTPQPNTQHNYVNQRIEDFDEKLDPMYAKPRKRCVTLQDDPVIVPPKTSRVAKPIKAERAQLVSTSLPVATVLSAHESTDEINQFIERENDRVERVKLRRRKHKRSDRIPPAFSNPNYVQIPILKENNGKDLSKSVVI